MEILHIKNLSFRYPEAKQNAVCDFSASVDSGEFILLCGQSGCGKTTLLKLLKKEIAPFGEKSGDIYYMGKPLSEVADNVSAGEIGFVMQDPDAQIVTDTVINELAFGLENLGLATPIIRRRVAEMASYFGIGELFSKKTDELSGGQKQMLGLAAVMAMQPKLLLLDEPTSQLDPIAAADFIATLKKLNNELGLTIILIEHRLEEVFSVVDRVWVMENGGLIVDSKPKNVGAALKNISISHPMLSALPTAARVAEQLGEKNEMPLTVKEGRKYITSNFDNKITSLPEKQTTDKNETVLECKALRFRYEKDLPDVLKDTELKVYMGETLSILGGNGTGKSTLLKAFAGIIKPYYGKIKLFGKKMGQYKTSELYRNMISLLPQDPTTLFISKTVHEDISEICNVMGYSKDDEEKIISDLAQKLKIKDILDRHPFDLSGGERQKAALALALVSKPKILLLDEPTKGIDAFAKRELADILLSLKAEGLTVVMVTHDVEFAALTADRCALFFDGEILSVDTPREFFAENHFYTTAANRMVKGYYNGALLAEDVANLCLKNGGKGNNK